MRTVRFTFSLRTLMLVVTWACLLSAGLAYVVSQFALRTSLDAQRGRYANLCGYGFTKRDPQLISQTLRDHLGKLPGYAMTSKPIDVGIDPALAAGVTSPGVNVLDHWSYQVKLSDGSRTQVAVWVYEHQGQFGAKVLIYACDTADHVQSGVAAKRNVERDKLEEVHNQVIMDLEREYQKKMLLQKQER